MFTGSMEFNFFGTITTYGYSESILIETIKYNLHCFTLFAMFIFIGSKLAKNTRFRPQKYNNKSIILFLDMFLLVFIFVGSFAVLSNAFSYWGIIAFKEKYNFFFEMRIIPHILISHIVLSKITLSKKTLLLLFIYFLVIVLLQARSVVLEFVLVFFISWLFTVRDKITLKLLLSFLVLPIVPNFFVVYRYWGEFSLSEHFSNMFSFEYLLLFNNIISEAIYSKDRFLLSGESFLSAFILVIPSPLRNVLGIDVQKHQAFTDISHAAGVFGGGFSSLAELYMNFHLWGALFFALLGLVIGYSRKLIINTCTYIECRCTNVSSPISCAVFILFYAQFILSFRNDLGVFIKISIQLFFVIIFLHFFHKVTFKIKQGA
jgi:hypothetical protein